MAPSGSAASFGQSRGSICVVFACFIVARAQEFELENHWLPTDSWGPSVKVSDLPAPTAGISGLSPLIQPTSQWIHVEVNYPGSHWSNIKDCFSYFVQTTIRIECIQPTKRIAVHRNSEWNLWKVQVLPPTGNLTVKATSFDVADETLIIDLVESLQPGLSYKLDIQLHWAALDDTDRFGIQLFNRTRGDTGDDVIAIGLSSAPRAMRHLIPCFDDPAYMIWYTWRVQVNFGLYPPAAVMMPGRRTTTTYVCGQSGGLSKTERYQRTEFSFPVMAIEAAHLRIVPYSWYSADVDVPQPPAECF